jgi:hypothetical protein
MEFFGKSAYHRQSNRTIAVSDELASAAREADMVNGSRTEAIAIGANGTRIEVREQIGVF